MMKTPVLFTTIKTKVEFALMVVFTHLIYFFGVGITSIIAKLVGKKFLNYSYRKSSWVGYKSNNQLKKMY